jgi:hypothetical protein
MAYPFNETFATGIPAGFATAGGSGSMTATWNATAQAVDLVFSQASALWQITAATQSSDFWFEMDVEIIASPASTPRFGFWLWDGVGVLEGHALIVWEGAWDYSARTASGAASESETRPSAWWGVVGARRTLRIDIKKSAQGVWSTLLQMDGEPVGRFGKRYYPSFLPCIFGWGITLRLHRAAGGTPSTLVGAPPLQGRVARPAVGRRILVPEHAAALKFNHRGLRLLTGTRSHYYHGRHRIRGTVKEKGLQADVPVSRRVLLVDERTWFVVRAAWSDAATGAYAFERINPDIRYVVMAFDHNGNYRAVVADNLHAEPMP